MEQTLTPAGYDGWGFRWAAAYSFGTVGKRRVSKRGIGEVGVPKCPKHSDILRFILPIFIVKALNARQEKEVEV